MSELIGAEIERKRGDTAPDVINITLTGGISGFGYKMTVNTEKKPTTTPPFGTELASITGTITATGPSGGTVEFVWTAPQADRSPGKYWYDIQQTDASGKIKTIAKNKYIFYQDITKT